MIKRTFLILLVCSLLKWVESSSTYRAAVIEFSPSWEWSGNHTKEQAIELMLKNLDQLAVFAETASSHGVDILVFPEDAFIDGYPIQSFTEPLPNVTYSQGIVPCNNNSWSFSPLFQQLSCLSQKSHLYLVANVGDYQCREEMSPEDISNGLCSPPNSLYFDTNVVFDRNGTFIAKYHKSHVFYDTYWNLGDGKPVSFHTDFDVVFGTFVCYDIQMATPQLYLLQENITNFVFTTEWINSPPGITATQVQQAWSRYWGVNLIASNIGASWYESGSGIYTAGKVLNSTFNPTSNPKSTLLISDVPKIVSGVRPSSTITIPSTSNIPKQYQVANMKIFSPAPGNDDQIEIAIPQTNITCRFSYTISPTSPSSSELFALKAINMSVSGSPVISCSVVQCPDLNPASCLNQSFIYQETQILWSSFAMSANYPPFPLEDTKDPSVFLPMIMTGGYELLDPTFIDFDPDSGAMWTTPSYEGSTILAISFSQFELLN